MAKRSKKGERTQAKLQDFVIVTVVDDMEQARELEALLKNNDIPVTVKEQNDESAGFRGFAVMVPEDYIDEAHVVIESQDAYEDFYDLALEEEDDSDFEPDFFDNEL